LQCERQTPRYGRRYVNGTVADEKASADADSDEKLRDRSQRATICWRRNFADIASEIRTSPASRRDGSRTAHTTSVLRNKPSPTPVMTRPTNNIASLTEAASSAAPMTKERWPMLAMNWGIVVIGPMHPVSSLKVCSFEHGSILFLQNIHANSPKEATAESYEH
jgi:hypothetical protein